MFGAALEDDGRAADGAGIAVAKVAGTRVALRRAGEPHLLTVTDTAVAAPEVARGAGGGAACVRLAESRQTLEDVYLELVAEDVEAAAR